MSATLELFNAVGAPPLQRCSLRFVAGTFNILRGTSGSGRTALLRLLGLLDPPLAGEVFFEGRRTAALDEPAREELRNARCGYLFPAPFLLAKFSVLENVAMPLFRISHASPDEAQRRTTTLLEFVGLANFAQAAVETLTPNQQHAASLARALANAPAVLFVENLPSDLNRLLREACERFGITIIASAGPEFSAEKTDRIIDLEGGVVRREALA